MDFQHFCFITSRTSGGGEEGEDADAFSPELTDVSVDGSEEGSCAMEIGD